MPVPDYDRIHKLANASLLIMEIVNSLSADDLDLCNDDCLECKVLINNVKMHKHFINDLDNHICNLRDYLKSKQVTN